MTKAPDPAIRISGLNKWYGNFHVLKDINLTVDQGERIVIAGPSFMNQYIYAGNNPLSSEKSRKKMTDIVM